MNIHNHSIWPPPAASALKHPAHAARYGALPQQSVHSVQIVPK
ncbi:hypothetical protein [Rhodocyclus purpureus]|nr:hypothetical protein [Rhodocyclus purpureus]